jgi:hypothetical protein
MKNFIVLTLAALALAMSATSVKADPPMPYCPPVCKSGQK